MEMTIKIDAPELTNAILVLAAAIAPGKTAAPAAAPGVPTAAPTIPTAAPVATPPGPAAAPAVPVAAPPTYTLDQIARAGASLIDAGKMDDLLALLSRYGVAAVTQLQPEQFGSVATELRALGAQL